MEYEILDKALNKIRIKRLLLDLYVYYSKSEIVFTGSVDWWSNNVCLHPINTTNKIKEKLKKSLKLNTTLHWVECNKKQGEFSVDQNIDNKCYFFITYNIYLN